MQVEWRMENRGFGEQTADSFEWTIVWRLDWSMVWNLVEVSGDDPKIPILQSSGIHFNTGLQAFRV